MTKLWKDPEYRVELWNGQTLLCVYRVTARDPLAAMAEAVSKRFGILDKGIGPDRVIVTDGLGGEVE